MAHIWWSVEYETAVSGTPSTILHVNQQTTDDLIPTETEQCIRRKY